MDSQTLAQWLASLSVSGRVKALTLIYSDLTVSTRSLFLSERIVGKAKLVLRALQGLNELHHTLANQLASYAIDSDKTYSIDGLCGRLFDSVRTYGLDDFLKSAVEFAQTRSQGEVEAKTDGLD